MNVHPFIKLNNNWHKNEFIQQMVQIRKATLGGGGGG
jgi:hypothetical protein